MTRTRSRRTRREKKEEKMKREWQKQKQFNYKQERRRTKQIKITMKLFFWWTPYRWHSGCLLDRDINSHLRDMLTSSNVDMEGMGLNSVDK
jgi:hypothetical protein